MRQAALLRKEKLLQALQQNPSNHEKDESSSGSEVEEDDDDVKLSPRARANPFDDKGLTDSDEEDDEEASDDEGGVNDDGDSDSGVFIADLRNETSKSVPTARSIPTARTITKAEPKPLNIFALQAKHFDCKREVQSTPTPAASQRGSLSLRNNLWLLPHSQLMDDIRKSKSGISWIGYEPEAEMYFRMIRVGVNGSEEVFFNWEPTPRYLNTWHLVESLVGSSQLDQLFQFIHSYPYHPAANLAVAEYHISQDQFDTAHQYLERALSSFQYGLSPALQLHKIRRPRLKSLDLRRMAQALSTLADDMMVVWQNSEGESQPRDPEARELEIKAALSIPENGNLMFCKCLHMYSLSLLQRGYSRAALEVFRFINVLTLGNDVSHSLPFLCEAAVRSRMTNILEEYNHLYLNQTAGIKFTSILEPEPKAEQPKQLREFKTTAFEDRLESLFPSIIWGRCCLYILKSGARTREVTRPVVEKILEDLDAEDLVEYINMRLRVGEPFEDPNPTLRDCCLESCFAMWLHPSFVYLLHNAKDYTSGTEEKELISKLSSFDLFTRKELFTCNHELSCSKLRERFLEAYVEQNIEFWRPFMVNLLLPAARKIGQLHPILNKSINHENLLHGGLLKHSAFLDQYRGIRKSEFHPRKPVLADALLNSSTEAVDTARAYQMRERAQTHSFTDTNLGRWWNNFITSTREINIRENAAINFLQSLMPWARIE